jgi:hypothetical protein
MLLSERVGASGEPRQAKTAGPWIVLNAGPCTDHQRSGLHRGLHKQNFRAPWANKINTLGGHRGGKPCLRYTVNKKYLHCLKNKGRRGSVIGGPNADYRL